MRIFAMSDTHGNIELIYQNLSRAEFGREPDDLLILCGDYLERSWDDDILNFAEIMDLQCRYPKGSIICLMGNHERDWLKEHENDSYAQGVARWVSKLPSFYETNDQIFVHAGIIEEARDLWRTGTPEEWMSEMFPPQTGSWDDGETHRDGERSKDIVAGHVSSSSAYLGGKEFFGRIYWDGENHFYIDGMTEKSGVLPMLEYDTEKKIYYAWDAGGDRIPIATR